MEKLDAAMARAATRRGEQALEPAVAASYPEICKLIAEFDPKTAKAVDKVELSTLMTGEDEKGKQTTYRVTAQTRSRTKRDLLLEGLSLTRKRCELADKFAQSALPTEINGKTMKPAGLASADGLSWVDRLIHQWLGGKREGMLICWDLGDGYKYQYDAFNHRLSRIPRSG